MKLDQIALIIVMVFGALWIGLFSIGILATSPFSIVGLIPVIIFVGLLGAVIKQRLNDKEDDYYDKNIHQ